MSGCSVCGKDVEARGLCHAHYQQWRAGVPHPAPLTRTPKGKYAHCTYDDCTAAHYAKGLCSRHYKRQWAGVPLQSRPMVGESHPHAKLTADAVRRIRALHQQGWSYVQLGTTFGVSDAAVRDAVRRRTWKHT